MDLQDREVVNHMSTLGNWMEQKGIVAYKVFSATDASDLPTGWTDPTKFTLDGVVFYDGKEMILFTDVVHQLLVKEKSTKTMNLDQLQEWLDVRFRADKGPYRLIGYGSKKFDAPLLRSKYNVPISAKDVDYAQIVKDASEKHYGDYGRRYDIRNLAYANQKKQTAIPHLSFLFTPLAMYAEWQRGLERNVLRTLAAEVELIAELFCSTIVKEELKIKDERTERSVVVQCDFVRDISIYEFGDQDEDPLTLSYLDRLSEDE
mgnify:CR=1 FL=1